MIYSGTYPATGPGGEPTGARSSPSGPKGPSVSATVKSGINTLAKSKAVQAMLTLGRYWIDSMDAVHKAFWIARATEETSRCRDGTWQVVSGYDLFLKTNMSALVAGEPMVNYPQDFLENPAEFLSYQEVSSVTGKVKIYAGLLFIPPAGNFVEWFPAAIHPKHVNETNPLKFTRIIGKVIPSVLPWDPTPPTDSVFLPLPWPVQAGDTVGFYTYNRRGSRTGQPRWLAERWGGSVVKRIAV